MEYNEYRSLILGWDKLSTAPLMEKLGINLRFRQFRKSSRLSGTIVAAMLGISYGQFRNQECGCSRVAYRTFVAGAFLYSKPNAFITNMMALLFAPVDGAGFDDWIMSGAIQSQSVLNVRAPLVVAMYQKQSNIGEALMQLRGDCSITDWSRITKMSTKFIRQMERDATGISLHAVMKWVMAASPTVESAMANVKRVMGV